MPDSQNHLYILNHPLVSHHLTLLRDRETPPVIFRDQVRRLTTLLTFAATQDLATQPETIVTPVASMECRVLSGRIAVIPILRAGLGMIDPVLDLIPTAEVWHLGYYRDERTLKPVKYYAKLPATDPADIALVIDPMLATGGSAIAAIETLREWGVPHIRLLSLIAAPEGIDLIRSTWPDVEIHVCAVDDRLNDKGYIVPGLGDAGDRIFNASPVD